MTNETSLNSTPNAERIHIGFYGMRNAGKSSVVNAILGQQLSIVSDQKGTTTDPVQKAMELLPLGPVVIVDTPGLDDEGELGFLRVQKAKQMLNKIDIAVLVVDATIGIQEQDREIEHIVQEKNIPYLIAFNKCDCLEQKQKEHLPSMAVSATTGEGIEELKNRIAALGPKEAKKSYIVSDLIEPKDFVVLVVPIDESAPKGRLILPQQQTIREILDTDATAIVVKEYELKDTLACLGKKPKLVITDSQVFHQVSNDTPNDVLLTSFSILFARYKGDLETTVKGVITLDQLNDGDTILISEGCTHHRQCNDIGTVKLPRWILNYTKKHLNFEFTQGTEFPEDLTRFAMIIHCGGCTLNEKEMKSRISQAMQQNVPITNYGITIAHMNGILSRSLQPFPSICRLLES